MSDYNFVRDMIKSTDSHIRQAICPKCRRYDERKSELPIPLVLCLNCDNSEVKKYMWLCNNVKELEREKNEAIDLLNKIKEDVMTIKGIFK